MAAWVKRVTKQVIKPALKKGQYDENLRTAVLLGYVLLYWFARCARRSRRRPAGAAGLTQALEAAELRQPQSFGSMCESGKRRVEVVEFQEFVRLYKKDLTFFVR